LKAKAAAKPGKKAVVKAAPFKSQLAQITKPDSCKKQSCCKNY
jgi:hypothetical protein